VVWQGSAGDRHPYADQTAFEEMIPATPQGCMLPLVQLGTTVTRIQFREMGVRLDGKVARRALSSAGAVVIRSASAKLPPPDVFHFRHRFFPPTKGFAAACFIHEATWCSSRSSTDASSTPRVDLPIPIGVTGGSGLISVPRMNISFT